MPSTHARRVPHRYVYFSLAFTTKSDILSSNQACEEADGMIEYRFSADDELDDFEDSAEIRLDDEMGDYGLDDDDDEVIEVVTVTPIAGIIVTGVTEGGPGEPAKESAPERKPAAKAAAPNARTL